MDDAIFNRKLVQIKQEIEKVDNQREYFTKDDVHELHKDECLSHLHKIEEAGQACQAKIIEFIYELNDTDAGDVLKITTLRNLSADLKQRIKQNANKVMCVTKA